MGKLGDIEGTWSRASDEGTTGMGTKGSAGPHKGKGSEYAYSADSKTAYALMAHFPEAFASRVTKLSQHLPPGAVVVDAGCGVGRGEELVPHLRYFGIDYSPTAIEIARSNHHQPNPTGSRLNGKRPKAEKRHFGVVDLAQPYRHIELLTGLADLVICSRVLQALSTREEVLEFLNNLHRICKSGAHMLISVGSTEDWKYQEYERRQQELGNGQSPMGEQPPSPEYLDANGMGAAWTKNYAYVMGLPAATGSDWFWSHLFTQAQARELLEQAGLECCEVFSYEDESGFDHLRHQGIRNTYLGFVVRAV